MTRRSSPIEPVAPRLRIRFKKLKEGGHSFACERPDGTQTWQRQPNISPLHDLTHYAVETVLGFRLGFYGLVADGWNLSDFGAPWPRGRIPANADPAELIVGFFDLERTMDQPLTAQDFNESKTSYYMQHFGRDADWELTEPQLAEIRARMEQLFIRWRSLGIDETLELPFPARDVSAHEPTELLGRRP